jgi:DnaA family protein
LSIATKVQPCKRCVLPLDLSPDTITALELLLANSVSIKVWVCIDNIEDASDTQQQELFDLYNQIKHTQTKLIVSAQNLPSELDLLKDLKTRLSLAVNFTLENLSDEQKTTILQNKMADKNIHINDKIYAYLFKHYSRDLSELLSAIEQLDEASLQKKTGITVPLIKQVL